MSVVIILALIGFILFAIFDYVEKFQRLRGTPFTGPAFWPILGNSGQMIRKKPTQIFDLIQGGIKQYGPLSRVYIANLLFLSITDPEYVEAILTSPVHINKAEDYSFLKNWLGDGLLLTAGKKWHIRRKILTPAFHFKILENFVSTFDKQAKIFVGKLKQFSPKTPVDVYPLISLCTFDVICETGMGCSVNSQLNENKEYVEGVKEITNILHKRMFNALLRSEFFFKRSKSGAEERKIVKIMHKWTDKVIEQKKRDLVQNNALNKIEGDADIGQKDKMALLDILLQSQADNNGLSDEDIREEVNTFMFAGHDTTTSAIGFLLYNLARHPKVQETILEEIDTVLGVDPERNILIGDLKNLTYLECVIKESLRLYAPVPMIGRYFPNETQLKDIRIPAKSTVIIAAFCMGRDPKTFPDPDSFKPERFLNEDARSSLFSYIPFSAGYRNCIGQKFAVLEIKTLAVRILQKYKLTVDPDYEEPILEAAIVLRPKNGIVLNLEPRLR